MANITTLESSALSAFCDSVATMLSAGIQTDEAVYLFTENMKDSNLKAVCERTYLQLLQGKSLAASMEASGGFPSHAINMVAAGEHSGRLENVLRSLSTYYDEESRLFEKIRSSVGYPAALLCVMSIILLFAVVVILPVFFDVYENISGDLTAGSFSFVTVSTVIGIIALIFTLACTIAAVGAAISSKHAAGRQKLIAILEKLPLSRSAMEQMALSRFTSALSTYLASGVDPNDAMKESMMMVEHPALKAKLAPIYDQMVSVEEAKSLAQAIYDNGLFEPIYGRMMLIGNRTGSTDEILSDLSVTFFDDAVTQIDRIVDGIEPALAAIMTVAIGATLVSVMLPLIGIMGSIG